MGKSRRNTRTSMIRVDTGRSENSKINIKSTSYTLSKSNRMGSSSRILRIPAPISEITQNDGAELGDCTAWPLDAPHDNNNSYPPLSDDDPAYLEHLTTISVIPPRPRVHVSASFLDVSLWLTRITTA